MQLPGYGSTVKVFIVIFQDYVYSNGILAYTVLFANIYPGL